MKIHGIYLLNKIGGYNGIELNKNINNDMIKRLEYINIDSLDTDTLKGMLTPECYSYCPTKYIQQLVTNKIIWDEISELYKKDKKQRNILVLDDDVILPSGFDSVFNLDITDPYNIIYIGDNGDLSSYIISSDGATMLSKLYKVLPFQHIDISNNKGSIHIPRLAQRFYNVFEITNYSNHPLINTLLIKIGLNDQTIANLNTYIIYLRKYDIGFNKLSLYLVVFSILVGLFGYTIGNIYLVLFLILVLIELVIWNNVKDLLVIKSVLSELVSIISGLCLGICINKATLSILPL